MALPPLTPEQRSAALQRATDARRERAAVKVRLKSSGDSIADVIASGKENDAIGKMRVSALLESMPGIGRVRAILEEMQQTGDVGRFAAAISGRMITNIEKGFALAHRRAAAGDQTRGTTSKTWIVPREGEIDP